MVEGPNIHISDAQLGAYVRGLIRASGAVPVGISQRRECLVVRLELAGNWGELTPMLNEIEQMTAPHLVAYQDAEEVWRALEAKADDPHRTIADPPPIDQRG